MFNPVQDDDSPALPATVSTRAETSAPAPPADPGWQLPAETITVRIHWFGLCVGYLLVNVLGQPHYRAELNGILTLGAVYALIDTWWSARGKVFLERWPLFISGMEALFIGLLCHFDQGLDSLFRLYYFLSLIICAFRNSQLVTFSTLGLHFVSYLVLASSQQVRSSDHFQAVALQLVFMAWVAWASTALASLL